MLTRFVTDLPNVSTVMSVSDAVDQAATGVTQRTSTSEGEEERREEQGVLSGDGAAVRRPGL